MTARHNQALQRAGAESAKILSDARHSCEDAAQHLRDSRSAIARSLDLLKDTREMRADEA